ncbi:MAG: hypothetical protein HQ592_10600 [Planctomycetes bacterium]|nr:hypothetical protein [Planctomycetota bacterium]
MMTPKERAVEALSLRQPDEVPTFELVFFATQEAFGEEFEPTGEWDDLSDAKQEALAEHNAQLYVKIAERYNYSIIFLSRAHDAECRIAIGKKIREMTGDNYMLVVHGDATYSIPDGNTMEEFFVNLFEKKEEMIRRAADMVTHALERNAIYIDNGIDGFALCADYCYNSGPFLSPPMFREFITQHLQRLVAGYKDMGAWVIKHTDGNIMPVLDQLAECEPHALHSLDPMAGVDIAEVKRLAGDKMCLMGNVDCSKLQTGTEDDVIASAEYAIKSGKPGGGYFFCTSNCVFPGLPLDRYELMMSVYEKYKKY